MKYKKCSRCQLNYVAESEEICSVCKRELRGERDEFDEDLPFDVCPYCEKNPIDYGEEMCEACRRKRARMTDEEI